MNTEKPSPQVMPTAKASSGERTGRVLHGKFGSPASRNSSASIKTLSTFSPTNNNDDVFRSGAQLLSQWCCQTREQKLERACIALLDQLNEAHINRDGCDLSAHIGDETVYCACADAYRMGREALKSE